MERLQETRPAGITRSALRTWGMLFLAMGIAGKSLLQNGLLNMTQITPQQLLELMQSSDSAMLYATLALGMRALETCAVPIFAFLLVDGVLHTSNFGRYCLRVTAMALASELPFNLADGGKLLDLSSRNPALGLVMGLILLHYYQRFAGTGVKALLAKGGLTLCAILWCSMLRIEYGGSLVFVVAVMWACWNKPLMRNIAGATASLVCSLNSLFFMASPMGVLAVHFYNGEKGEENRLVNYLAYPVLLLALGLAGMYLV